MPVPTPDFEDLDTALNEFQYGWLEDITKSTEAKQARVLELMDDLIVVDDIDSIEKDDDVIEFFTFLAPQTLSKVLLTSRRTVFGMATSISLV